MATFGGQKSNSSGHVAHRLQGPTLYNPERLSSAALAARDSDVSLESLTTMQPGKIIYVPSASCLSWIIKRSYPSENELIPLLR